MRTERVHQRSTHTPRPPAGGGADGWWPALRGADGSDGFRAYEGSTLAALLADRAVVEARRRAVDANLVAGQLRAEVVCARLPLAACVVAGLRGPGATQHCTLAAERPGVGGGGGVAECA